MLSWTLHSLARATRSVLLGLGLLAVTIGVVLLAAASETTVVTVDQDLSRYWRTTYDILVRPAGARSLIEEKYGLVEANHLSGIWGGITITQYETIKTIPGVEVAAPLAMLGYVAQFVPAADLGAFSDPGAYVQEETLTVDDGARVYRRSRSEYYYLIRGAAPEPPSGLAGLNYPAVFDLNTCGPGVFFAGSAFEMPFLVAGIDPPQEAALIGLDQALLEGEYLTGEEPVNPRYDPDACFAHSTIYDLPVLINATPYIRLKIEAEFKRLTLPPEAADLQAIMERGGNTFLASLPGERVAYQEIDSATAYHRLVRSLRFFGEEETPTDFMPVHTIHTFAPSAPGAIIYRESQPPSPYNGLTLEILLPERGVIQFGWGGEEWPAYRSSVTVDFRSCFTFVARGVFDIERLPRPADVHRVPLETYFPPLATLRYDEAGRPVEPRTLRPTLNPAGYIQPPPLILTTLAAAQAVRGEDCISAIRVRVGGIGQLTPAAQRKIEAVATEIFRRTGLTVDVMVGSSPRRVLVRVPGVGYVEEGWIQKGVNVAYARRVQSGHLLLLAALLVIGGLYTLDLAWADLLARRRTIALQKALGWRSRTVFGQVLGKALLIGVMAAFAGALSAWGLAVALGWAIPSPKLLVGLPLLTIGLSLAGSLYPAWLAARLPPIPVLQMAGLRTIRTATPPLIGLWTYSWRSLMRRWSRTLLSGLAAALSSALLVLLLAVSLEQQGYLVGTLLGEHIAARIEGYHYALVGIGFGLAALAVANSLLAGLIERQREIGALKAVGWRTGAVVRLFLAEGLLLGVAGGMAGTLLGLGAFWSLYRALMPGLARISLLGVSVPALVGVLAALYPAGVAARVPPAEAMRYE